MHRVIIIPHYLFKYMDSYFESQAPNEGLLYLSGGISTSGRHFRFMARKAYTPKPEDYAEQTPFSVRETRDWMQRALGCIARDNESVITVHPHPFAGEGVSESCTDQEAARTMLPAMAHDYKHMAILTMVVNRHIQAVDAHVFNQVLGRREPIDMVCVPQPQRYHVLVPTSAQPFSPDEAASEMVGRLALAFGPETVALCSRLHAAIIGAGGLGEPLAVMLANLGCELTIVDQDRFGLENANRSWYGNETDRFVGRPKVEMVRDAVLQTRPAARVHALEGDIRDAGTQHALKPCHLVVVGTDNVASRYVASHMAMTQGQVLFDVGTEIDVTHGRLSSVRGQVMRLTPGLNLCHHCAGFFKNQDVRQALLHEKDYEEERRRGYIKGADMPAPSVIALNATLAGHAVWEILRYLAGASPDHAPDLVGLDLLRNTCTPVTYPRNADGLRTDCPVCSPTGYLFQGDRAPLMTRETRSRDDRLCAFLDKEAAQVKDDMEGMEEAPASVDKEE